MRTIKFRAWDKTDKIMFDAPNHPVTLDGRLLSNDNNDVTDNYELMQFTGLFDKNGKEIYEGDIISVPWGFNSDYHFPQMNVIVKWDDDKGNPIAGFIIEPINKAITVWQDFTWRDTEIIGNIYENPELLNPMEGEEK